MTLLLNQPGLESSWGNFLPDVGLVSMVLVSFLAGVLFLGLLSAVAVDVPALPSLRNWAFSDAFSSFASSERQKFSNYNEDGD